MKMHFTHLLPHLTAAIFYCFLIWHTPTLAQQTFVKLCDVQNFDDYLAQTGKVYKDEKERQYRESIFIGKKSLVDLTNKYAASGLSSFQLAINPLADLTRREVGRMTASRITFIGE